MEIWDVNAFTSSSEVMTVTELIFMNITLAQQLFVMNSHNEFHENLTNGSVTTRRSQTNRQQMDMVSTYGTCIF